MSFALRREENWLSPCALRRAAFLWLPRQTRCGSCLATVTPRVAWPPRLSDVATVAVRGAVRSRPPPEVRDAAHGRALTHSPTRLPRLVSSRRRPCAAAPAPPRPRTRIPPHPTPVVRSPRTLSCPRTRSPVPGPRSPSPRRLPHLCIPRTLVLSSPPLTYAAVDSRAPTLPRPHIRVPQRPRPHGRVSAPISARPRLRSLGRRHGCNSRETARMRTATNASVRAIVTGSSTDMVHQDQ